MSLLPPADPRLRLITPEEWAAIDATSKPYEGVAKALTQGGYFGMYAGIGVAALGALAGDSRLAKTGAIAGVAGIAMFLGGYLGVGRLLGDRWVAARDKVLATKTLPMEA